MKPSVICYSETEMNALQRHIERNIGKIADVYHERFSEKLHVDVCVVEPTKEKNWYTLVTMGMGAYRMSLPEQLKNHRRPRAELVLRLPASWKIHSFRGKWRWPLSLLADLARYPLLENTFLSAGHTVDMQRRLFRNVGYTGALLIPTELPGCLLPSMEMTDFYQVIPLYPEELEFKRLMGLDPLMERLEQQPEPCLRENTVPREEPPELMLDWCQWHLRAVEEKHLKVEELAAYNHMALFLRWFMEQGLVGECFSYMYPELIREVLDDPWNAELREFIRDALSGVLSKGLFSYEGAAFAGYCYDPEGDAFRFGTALDGYAESYFGTQRYNSEEFQNEAYLFLPYDDDYYQAVKTVLDGLYAEWKKK